MGVRSRLSACPIDFSCILGGKTNKAQHIMGQLGKKECVLLLSYTIVWSSVSHRGSKGSHAQLATCAPSCCLPGGSEGAGHMQAQMEHQEGSAAKQLR